MDVLNVFYGGVACCDRGKCDWSRGSCSDDGDAIGIGNNELSSGVLVGTSTVCVEGLGVCDEYCEECCVGGDHVGD